MTHREAYALCAGFAIGLINLGLGNELNGRYHNETIELLRLYMIGGMDPQMCAQAVSTEPPPPNGLMGPAGVPWNGALDDAENVQHIPLLFNGLVNDPPAPPTPAGTNGQLHPAQVCACLSG